MIFAAPEQMRARAERLLQSLARPGCRGCGNDSRSVVARRRTKRFLHGSVELTVSNPMLSKDPLADCEMHGPVIARIERDKIILDMRTIADEEEKLLAVAIQRAQRIR